MGMIVILTMLAVLFPSYTLKLPATDEEQTTIAGTVAIVELLIIVGIILLCVKWG